LLFQDKGVEVLNGGELEDGEGVAQAEALVGLFGTPGDFEADGVVDSGEEEGEEVGDVALGLLDDGLVVALHELLLQVQHEPHLRLRLVLLSNQLQGGLELHEPEKSNWNSD
jgi:hypothetical protein